MYKLIIEDDEGKTTVVPLIRDEITIGRKEGNTIRLTERNVSRKHARLLKQNGHIFIEDVSSYNGIKLNGDKIEGRASVGEGDRIQIGDYQLALKMERQAGAPNGNGAGSGQADGRAATPAAPMPVVANDEKTLPYQKESASGVPTAMIEAPTIQNTMVPVRNENQGLARLVVTSSNFAGQEFLLDKAAVVIGRTDENDVVINHRSISRHHAKVVRENGHYHVVDLQSANGVRVNGEEYGKVELRRGDHIDLGHVRLRFVAPGEDFLFERDAQVVDVSGGKGSRTSMYVVLALCLIVGGGFAAWKLSSGGGPGPVPPKPTTTDVDGQVSRLLLDADRALKNEEWDVAIGKCDEALRLDAGQEIARDKKQRAEAERKNHAAYLRFQQAAEKADLDGAVAAFGEISEDSIYHQRGTEPYARVKKGFIRQHLDEAKKQKAANDCDAARQHVSAVLTVDESNQEASTIMQNCGAPVKPVAPVEPKAHPVTPKPTTPKPDKPVKPDGASKPEATSKPDQPTESDTPGVNVAAEKALADAQDAYVHGQYSTAIELARKAMKSQPAKSARIIGACSCFLKDRAGAVAAYQKCDNQGRSFLKWVCARSNITVP